MLRIHRADEPQEVAAEDQRVDDGDEGVQEEDFAESGEQLDLRPQHGEGC